MTSFQRYAILIGALAVAMLTACRGAAPEPVNARFELRDNWYVVAARTVEAPGEEVASPGFATTGWTPASVPSTPMAALVRSGAIEDPYFDRALERAPTAQFEGPWWYRTEFLIDTAAAPGARLVFEGINYRADIFLNGRRIAASEDIAGAFRVFELDVAGQLLDGVNTLAVLVHPPQPGDPTIGFVDWNPLPPDRNMGLWRPVVLHTTGAVALDRVFVRSKLDVDTLAEAEVIVEATRGNNTDREVEAVLTGTISGGIALHSSSVLAPREERRIRLTAKDIPALRITNPRLWWPNGMGDPELYELALDVAVDGAASDSTAVTFGIRHVDDYINDEGHRGYAINGREFLVRGGGWVDDMLLMEDPQKIEDQLRYVRHMNLNTIRLEGFWGSTKTLYNLADRYGILIMVGWSCQWEWENYLGQPVDEFGGIDTPEEIELVSRSLADQVRWLRNHPSILVWVLASDMLPRTALEKAYREQLADEDTTRPALSTCAVGVSEVSGPSGVKMNGPYDWVSPNYWYLDTERGGAYGFNTETGPGPQPGPAASMRRMLPEAHWWPRDDMWDYHSGRNTFDSIDRYAEALEKRYGPTANLDEFAQLAQVANYEGMRAMFESFTIRRPVSTGLIQWMLNSAWPEMYWQLYDYYLVPNGAFYGARDGSRAVNVAYDYADGRIIVVNETNDPLREVTARLRVYDLESALLVDESQTVDVGPQGMHHALTVPKIDEAAGNAYFVDLRLASVEGEELASSFYWLSTQPDVPDWNASEWFYTPMAEFADLTGLQSMPSAELEVEHALVVTDDGYRVDVQLHNPGEHIAFFVELAIEAGGSGRLAAPVIWSDNYVSLVPGESRSVSGEIPSHALQGEEPAFRYAGINVDEG